MIGVTDFLFFSNDCTDGTDLLLDRLSKRGMVLHLPNPAKGKSSYVVSALRRAMGARIYRESDWVIVTDADEFPDIVVGDGTIPDLIVACGNPQAISFSLAPFGSAGITKFEDLPISQQFFRRRPIGPDLEHMRLYVKTLFRSGIDLDRLGAHRPFLAGDAPVDWRDGSGKPAPLDFVRAEARTRMLFDASHSMDFAKINHHSVRSLESYIVKVDRGDAANSPISQERQFGIEYWQNSDRNEVEDRGLVRHAAKLAELMKELMSDEETARLHAFAVKRHREMFARLMEQPRMQALYAEIVKATGRQAA